MPQLYKIGSYIIFSGQMKTCHWSRLLRKLIRFIEANSEEIEEQWIEHFGEIRYFC